jgi:hypothetical protein
VLALALAVAATGEAAELGRLFLTPLERATLERLRAAPAPPVAATAEPEAATEPPLPENLVLDPLETLPPVTVNGFVARSDGAATVWINGADALRADLSAIGVDARRLRIESRRVRVPLPAAGGEVALKAGQTFDPASRRVSDAYDTPPTE